MAKIAARRADTRQAWIRMNFPVINLIALAKVLFGLRFWHAWPCPVESLSLSVSVVSPPKQPLGSYDVSSTRRWARRVFVRRVDIRRQHLIVLGAGGIESRVIAKCRSRRRSTSVALTAAAGSASSLRAWGRAAFQVAAS